MVGAGVGGGARGVELERNCLISVCSDLIVVPLLSLRCLGKEDAS